MVVKKMKVNEIRNLTTDEIIAKIKESKEELFNLRFQQATGNLDKPSKIKDLRHTVARLKTVLRERELEEQGKAK
jgi:large subunit ribosomal protein L29